MDRYIILELIPPFLFGVGAFTSLGVSVGALFELIRRVSEYGLPLGLAVRIFMLKMPEFISYSFPMSVLLSALMTYSRFSSDSELVALKGCGIKISRIILPAILLSLCVTGIAFTFNELIVPIANYRATVIWNDVLGRDQLPAFQEENILYQEYEEDVPQPDGSTEDVLSRLFYARRFDGQVMYGLTILDFTQERLSQIISAQSAQWNGRQGRWDFFDGAIYLVSADGSYGNILKFEQQQLQLPRTPLDLAASQKRDADEMNLVESWERVRILRQKGSRSRLRRLLIRIHQKYSLPFACLVFGLTGAVLGSRLRRTGRAISFAISVLIIFGYYLLYSICSALAHAQVLSPLVSAWIPNISGLLIGGVLLIRANR
ncbi:MAG: YjgP/YjgQ family permease [Merismopedia sp. SIO2A8]|nr:YjgP/YjgQ family permease [Merismopedia sp. SIO2A8]